MLVTEMISYVRRYPLFGYVHFHTDVYVMYLVFIELIFDNVLIFHMLIDL